MKRVGSAWVLLSVLMLAAGLNTWVLLADALVPVWNKPSAETVFSMVGWVLAAFCSLGGLAALTWGLRMGLAMMGLLFSLAFALLMFSPLLLFINQSIELAAQPCQVFQITGKRELAYRKGRSYEVFMAQAHGESKTLRISEAQFDALMVGHDLAITVSTAILGVDFVSEMRDAPVAACRG